MIKIISIIGARPQFIKAAPLSKALREKFSEKIIHTGQHYDFGMSEVFFNELQIPQPDFNLGIGSGNHGKQTGEMLIEIEKILINEKPDLVIVFGDTNTTLAGALSASKLNIKLAHVEAGLRSFNRFMPEEKNRVVTDVLSDILFVPSENAKQNLLKEGISNNIHNVGDIMYDSLLLFGESSYTENNLLNEIMIKKDYSLLTLHRAENVDDIYKLKQIILILGELPTKIVFPIHPRTKKKIKEFNIKLPDNIFIVDPVSYVEMIKLIRNCRVVLTDSGGVQKDAYYLKKKCITLRSETEWIETVELGWNRVTSIDKFKIKNAFSELENESNLAHKEIYGNGKTAFKIVNCLENLLSK